MARTTHRNPGLPPHGHRIRRSESLRQRLTGLPAGRYKVKAWLNSRTTLERDVELNGQSALRLDFP